MSLTDAQLRWILLNRISHHNGFKCGRSRDENGMRGTEYVCQGSTAIRGGCLVYDTIGCGEPCDFICDDVGKLQKEIERLKMYESIITEAKELMK